MIVPEPTIVPAEEQNKEFWDNDQIATLFNALQNLQFTSRDGAIQHNDKAGNLSAVHLVYISNGVANTDDTILHGLGRVPVGYLVVKQDKIAIVYDGTVIPTTSAITLRTSAATVALTVMVF